MDQLILDLWDGKNNQSPAASLSISFNGKREEQFKQELHNFLKNKKLRKTPELDQIAQFLLDELNQST